MAGSLLHTEGRHPEGASRRASAENSREIIAGTPVGEAVTSYRGRVPVNTAARAHGFGTLGGLT
jgi:hypothetical protein